MAESKHDPGSACGHDGCPFDLPEGHLVGDHPTLTDALQSMKKAAAPEEPSEVADLRHEVSRLEWRIEEKEDDIASLSSALGKAEDRAAKYAKDYAGAQEKYVAANDKLIHCQKALAIIVQSSHGDNDGTMARGIAEEALDAVDAI